MNEQNFIENQLVILTKQTIDIFRQQDNPADLIALYTFYYYTSKWQNTNSVYCTTSFVANGLKWSEARVRKVKKQLIEFGLIEDVKGRDAGGKINGHYIKMNYIFKKETVEKIDNLSHTYENSYYGDDNGMESQQTNALSTYNQNALSSNTLNKKINKKENQVQNLNTEFETLWKLYPKKQGKPKSLTYYIKARKKGTSYDEVLKGIKNYLEYIKQKKIDMQYVKQGSTWFNNQCWNDEYEVQAKEETKKVCEWNGIKLADYL